MREVTLQEIYDSARGAYHEIWQAARDNGRDVKLYLHWTAGRYDQTYGDYHINITGDGRVWLTAELTDILAATYRRNSGSVSIALCCAYNAVPDDLGAYSPTDAQINAMSQVVATLANALDLTIDLRHVMTHAEAADNQDGLYCHDPYGPLTTCERWDLDILCNGQAPHTGGNELRGNANYYRAQWQAGGR